MKPYPTIATKTLSLRTTPPFVQFTSFDLSDLANNEKVLSQGAGEGEKEISMGFFITPLFCLDTEGRGSEVIAGYWL